MFRLIFFPILVPLSFVRARLTSWQALRDRDHELDKAYDGLFGRDYEVIRAIGLDPPEKFGRSFRHYEGGRVATRRTRARYARGRSGNRVTPMGGRSPRRPIKSDAAVRDGIKRLQTASWRIESVSE